MASYRQKFLDRLLAAVDWFIPSNLKENGTIVQGTRMFLFSHLFGPFLGHTISLYILFLQGKPDTAWWIFFGAITAFWPFPLVLKLTGQYVPLALISIQNLIFCIFWGCSQYGGSSSPILPWMITVPLLAFFYLPTRKTRIIVSCLIFINIAGFSFYSIRYGFTGSNIPVDELSGLGMVSTFCAGVYVSMMALYYANIVAWQSELELEIQRHLATTRQLRAATDEAERAMQAKSEFLAKMSHELRTPLNAILGYSEMLLDESDEADDKTTDLKRIHGAGKKLLGLINDLLDLSKLEAGKHDFHPKAFDLTEFLGEIATDWQAAIAENDISFDVDHADDHQIIINDAPKLRRTIDNLLDNAMRFARGGRVTLSARVVGDRLLLMLEDNGSGIGAERIATIFDGLVSSNSETSSKYEESPGLGLALGRRMCRLMGGDLSVESERGHGSRFAISVPARYTPSRDAAVDPIAADGAEPDFRQSGNVVLAIDDDPSALDLIARILSREGIIPILARTAVDGISQARETIPAAIILDIRMSPPDGWQALRLVREDPRLRSTKIILLTVDDDFAKGRVLGADAHLLKPVDKDALLRCLADLCPGLPGGAASAEQRLIAAPL
jgi:signal transduction histidine kinase/CheY-like chemotaxis protein